MTTTTQATTTPAQTRKPARTPHGTCRLTLTINGTAYAVKPVPCDPSAALTCIELRKADGTLYHASRHAHGAECTCPDFIFHRDGRDPAGCKHVKALAAVGLLGGPCPEPEPDDAGDASTWPAWTDAHRYAPAR